MGTVKPEVRIPFVHRAHPEVYAPLFKALAKDPLLLVRTREARRELAGDPPSLQALSRHAGAAEPIETILGDFAPLAPDEGPAGRARALLRAMEPYEYFLREVGTALKAPLVRPKASDIELLRDLADLSALHAALYRPAAVWFVAAGTFGERGCTLTDPPATFGSPSMRGFFASPLREPREEEVGDAGGGCEDPGRAVPIRSCVVVYLVTVGPGWDEAAGEYIRSGRPYLALLANALGAGAADTVAEDLNDLMDRELLGGDPERRLRRLSPGYGDWPLSDQKVLVRLLNAQETLGVTLTEGDILVPEKSTSGIMAEKRSEEVRKRGS